MPGPAPHHGADVFPIYQTESPNIIRSLREELTQRRQEILEQFEFVHGHDGFVSLQGRFLENKRTLQALEDLEKAERHKWQGQS